MEIIVLINKIISTKWYSYFTDLLTAPQNCYWNKTSRRYEAETIFVPRAVSALFLQLYKHYFVYFLRYLKS